MPSQEQSAVGRDAVCAARMRILSQLLAAAHASDVRSIAEGCARRGLRSLQPQAFLMPARRARAGVLARRARVFSRHAIEPLVK